MRADDPEINNPKTGIVKKWRDKMEAQGQRKAQESLSVNLATISHSPAHDKLTAEKAEAVEYKRREWKRQNEGKPGGGLIVDWEKDIIRLGNSSASGGKNADVAYSVYEPHSNISLPTESSRRSSSRRKGMYNSEL